MWLYPDFLLFTLAKCDPISIGFAQKSDLNRQSERSLGKPPNVRFVPQLPCTITKIIFLCFFDG